MTDIDIEAISRQHFARIRRAALVLTGNPWDADDLAQETFLVFARQPRKFEGRSQIYTWLYGILLNLDRRRRRQLGARRQKLQVLWRNMQTDSDTTPPADLQVRVAEWKQTLWALVDELPSGQREALVLRYSEELRYDEIAEALECPLGTVKSRIFHGLANLRRLVDERDANALLPPQQQNERTGS